MVLSHPQTGEVYTSLSYPARLFDWLITLSLTLINCDNIILEQSAGSKSGVYIDLYCSTRDLLYTSPSYPAILFDWLIILTLTLTLINCDNIILEQSAGSKSGVYIDFPETVYTSLSNPALLFVG